jgi:hypothetical protein
MGRHVYFGIGTLCIRRNNLYSYINSQSVFRDTCCPMISNPGFIALIATIVPLSSKVSLAKIVREKAPSPAIEIGANRCARSGGSTLNGRGSGVFPGVKIISSSKLAPFNPDYHLSCSLSCHHVFVSVCRGHRLLSPTRNATTVATNAPIAAKDHMSIERWGIMYRKKSY